MSLAKVGITRVKAGTVQVFIAISVAFSVLSASAFVSSAQSNMVSGAASGAGSSSTVSVAGVQTSLPLPPVGGVSLPPNGGSQSNHVDSVNLGVPALMVLQTGAIDTMTSGSLNATSAHAQSTADVDGVNIAAGLVTASNVHSVSTTDGNGSTASSNSTGTSITGLVVAGTPYPGQPPPNTVIPITNYNIGLVNVSGTVTLNEQVSDGNGTTTSGLSVNGIHVNVTGSNLGGLNSVSIDVVVGSAFSGVDFTPGPNSCPTISVSGGTTRSVQVGQTLSFSVSATDPDGGNVTLQASNLPANSTFTPNPASGTPTATGTFSFTPTALQGLQTFNVSFGASDNQGCGGASPVTTVVAISVTLLPPANSCPNVAVTGGLVHAVQVGQTLSFSVSGTDPDGNTVTLQASNLPANSTFSPNPASGTPTATGTFSFTPAAAQASQIFTVNFAASDNQGCSGAQVIPTPVVITVTPAPPINGCPSVSVTGGTVRTVPVGQTLSFSVSGNDPEGNTVTLQASNLPANSTFTPNPATGTPTATGTFSFTPSAAQASQIFVVNFSASDNQGCSGALAVPTPVAITVTPPANNCPTITVNGSTNRSVQVGQSINFSVSATDPDGNTVTLQASNLPANSSFTPNPASGTPTASGTFSFTPIASQASQTFNVSFTASDSQGCSGATPVPVVVTITVTSAPPGNNCPNITVTGGTNRSVQVGQSISFSVSATDPDGNTVTLQASSLPANSSFTPNPASGTPTATGTFNFTPTAPQTNQTFNVSFRASDTQGCNDAAAIPVTVAISVTPAPPGNNCPNVTITEGTSRSARVGQTLSFSVSAIDPDGDTVTLQASNLPANSTFSPNPASGSTTVTGTFSFTPNALQAGKSFNISFTSSDSHGCSGSAQVSVGVEASGPVENICGNHAPIISVPSLPMIGSGQTLQFVVRATDQDGDEVVLSPYSMPAGAAFDRASGNFTFTPSSAGVDMYRTKLGQSSEAIFLARDSKGAETMARVDIRSVINTGNLPLQISVPPGPVLVKSADELSFGVAVSTHLTGCSTKITALGLPSNATFDDVTNMFSFKPTPEQVGEAFVVQFSTADCNGVSHKAAVRISVIDSDSACNFRGVGTAEVPVRKLDFNSASVGDRCGAATVSITNRGGGSLVISSAALSNPESFRVEGFAQLPATLQPGAVIEFRVFFEPKHAGKASETLTLFTSDPNNPALEIRLLGKGVK